jgi:hypothetical protein
MVKSDTNTYNGIQFLGFLLAGMLSGIITAYIFTENLFFIFLGPGVIFGIVLSLYHYFILKYKHVDKLCVFVIASTISYFAAVVLYWRLSNMQASFGIGSIGSLFISGLVGSMLLLVGYRIFIARLSFRSIFLLTLWGGILSLALFTLATSYYVILAVVANYQFSDGFLIWQTGMAGGLGFMGYKKIRESKISIIVLLFFGIITLILLIKNNQNTKLFWDAVKNDYQIEISSIVSSNFTLKNSQFENRGLDSGLWLIDTYTTQLNMNQAFSFAVSQARKKGYTLTRKANGCFGGFSSHGYVNICKSNVPSDKTTLEFGLNNFTEVPDIKPFLLCVGFCP